MEPVQLREPSALVWQFAEPDLTLKTKVGVVGGDVDDG
jgi:hypothetical protein